ncbi:Transposable element Tc3 transposase [Frankliniella fusca]|uniref:Transposable element Tc3 transposase n=1 Tax=Frankliniella fusca TaxID=407009 RepID=A0AAE1HAU3_9NEOP|nr:Transposable element Tc3 transposase [Frankliniella fusca]
MNCQQIAAHPDVHYTWETVRYWICRYEAEGYEGLKTRPRSGRTRVVADDDTLLITATVLARPKDTVQEKVQELTPHLAPHIDTVYKRDDILEGVLLPAMTERLGEGAPFRFVQDNAPIHTAHVVRDWFEEHPFITKLPWPASSPDMNLNENLFGLIALEWDPRFERTAEALDQHAREVFAAVQRRPPNL